MTEVKEDTQLKVEEAEVKLEPILKGVKILDIAHQYSAAMAASLLGDLGAEVVSIEHPNGSPIRTMLPRKGEHSMWWKTIQRGKKSITLDLSSKDGQEIFKEMAKDFDVIVENFRPGTLEKWNLGPEDLEKAGVNIVLLRISGFGQTGPYKNRPGFGTIAEAISGFAHLNGFPDGPPIFPSVTLADGVAGTFGALGIVTALLNRERTGNKQGVEVVDVALFETLFRLIPTQISGYDQLKKVPKRPGNFLSSHGVLRNLYQSKDGRYITVAAVGEVAMKRILLAADAHEQIAKLDAGVAKVEDPAEFEKFLIECNEKLMKWSSEHTYDVLAEKLTANDAVFQTVFNVEDIISDPHYQAREDLIQVHDSDLGSIMMQGIVPKFQKRNHKVSHAGPQRGEHNEEIYGKLKSVTKDRIEELKNKGIV